MEFTLSSFFKNFWKIVLNFFLFHVYHCKFSNSRCVYYSTSKMPKMHLSKSSGVLSFIMRFRNFVGFQIQIRLKCICQSRFSSAGGANKCNGLPGRNIESEGVQNNPTG